MLRDLADERSDRRKLLKIAGGCTIICALDGTSLGSPRGMPEASRSGLDLSISATDQLGRALCPDRVRLLRLKLVRMQGLIVMLAAWHAAASRPLRIVRCRPPRQSTTPYGERWIEKSTHRSREDML
jgi:hypothetical protein